MSGRRLWWLALAAPLLLSLPGLRVTAPGQLLTLAEAQLRQGFFRLRGPQAAPPEPVILAIDSDSLQLPQLMSAEERQASTLRRRMGEWPWPRQLQADLATLALRGGAARVLFNVEFSQPSRYGPEDDRAFARILEPWRSRVHLAVGLGVRERGGLEQVQLRLPIHHLGEPGLSSLLQSPQGVAEAIPGTEWLLSNLADFPPPLPRPMAFLATSAPMPQRPLGLNPAGPAGTMERVTAWQAEEQPEGFWRGRTVLIGVTAPELGDQQETAFGAMSGTELQAMALANVLAGDGLRSLPFWAEWAVLLGWAAIGGFWLARCTASGGTFTAMAALAFAALLGGGLALLWGHITLPMAALTLTPLLGGGLRGSSQVLREGRERAALQQVLARRISPGLLRDILREPGELGSRIGGSRARCAVLFSDLVDFTPLSSGLEPADLFALLNRYFAAVSVAVIEEQGLLDKFIGDALMAEFGVPRSRGDREEARAAIRAALAMQRRLEALNLELAAAGGTALKQGIGVHFGEVIAGNLGSPERLEFTVVGAVVNVASRLEGLTRLFPEHPILISGAVLDLLPGELVVEPLGPHRLKGWPDLLDVFALKGIHPSAGIPQ